MSVLGRARAFTSAHRAIASSLIFAIVAGAIFVIVWFQPQKLFIEETVNESLPMTSSSPSPGASASPIGPKIIASGPFRSLEHETTGSALLLRLEDGSTVLRFDDLDTSNGPDLRVYLSPVPAGPDWRAYGDDALDLGKLKGNRGDQNYAIPAGTDLSKYRSAVVWCRRFTVGFGVAPLTPA